MGQLPRILEALVARIEAALAEQPRSPATRGPTEALLGTLRKQAAAMRAVVESAAGEGLTPEQMAAISKVPVPQPSLFPAWARDGKESK